jgi:hypothetical protein
MWRYGQITVVQNVHVKLRRNSMNAATHERETCENSLFFDNTDASIEPKIGFFSAGSCTYFLYLIATKLKQ